MLENLLRPTNFKRAIFFIVVDVFISFFTIYLAYFLRFNLEIPNEYYYSLIKLFFLFSFLKVLFLYFFKIYFVSWRFFSLYELKRLFLAISFAYISGILILFLFKNYFLPFPRSAIIIDYFLSLIFLGMFRIAKRLYLENFSITKPPAVIIGANEKTLNLFKSDIPYSIVGIYEDDEKLIGSYIQGKKILNIKDLENVENAIIVKDKNLTKIFEILKEKNVKNIKIYNTLKNDIKDISIEDLLARKPKELDLKAIEEFIKDKKILITGAGGSIGSEISRQCEKFGAKELILVDMCEFNLYSINEEIKINKKAYLIDVSNYEDIERVIKKEKPDIVIHAAAYKHVPLCEANPRSAVINNIVGTKNTIDVSIKYNVKKFVLISTDKAVRPTNVMGATKRVCELYAQNVPSSDTIITAVRFGNVLGSSGSVIPKFKKCIENNEPLPVTHPDITRYFMTIPEACQLVLQAASLAKDRELFILDMGEPVKIVDLAKTMLKLYGKNENNIIFTSLRPGEKLYEELLINESDKKTKYRDIFVASKTLFNINELNKKIEILKKLSLKKDIIKVLKEIVTEYNHH